MKRGLSNKNKVWDAIYTNFREVWDDGVTIAVKPFSIPMVAEKTGLTNNAVRFAIKQLIQARLIWTANVNCFGKDTAYIMR